MHPLAKKLLIAKQFRLDEGDVSVLGSESLILPYQLILEIDEYLPKDKVYTLGEKSGNLIGNTLRRLGLGSSKLDSFALDLLSMDGWGKFKMVTNNRSQSIIHVENSLLAKDHTSRRTKEPKCMFLAGLLGSIWSTSYDTRMVAVESKCLCQGNKFCEFVIRPA